MRRLTLWAVVVAIAAGMGPVVTAQLELPDKYMESAVILADWLVDNVHPAVPSWPYPWDPTRTDAGVAMDIVRVLNHMADLTGTASYADAAQAAAEFWVTTNILRDEAAVSDWLWDIGGTVQNYGWEEGAFEKVQYAFAGSYWPVKGEYAEVRGGTISFCGSVVRPLAGLLTFGDQYAEAIDTVTGWLFTDLDNKMPPSGNSPHRAYLGAQTLTDSDGDGLIEVQYQLWGSSRQSAGQNARLLAVLLDLGYQDEAIAIADWLLEVMWDEERGWFQTLFDVPAGACMTFEEYQDYSDINARTAYGLLRVYEATGDARYLDYATRTLDWLVDEEMTVVPTEAGVQTYFTKPTVYGNHIIVVSLAKGYQVTGNPKYLSAALTTADFLLGQMDDPFTGVESNAWTVQEALEALLALLNLQGAKT
ncbi:MAG: glycoside hydrolase family 88 protein [Candidatus Bipolaricaulaceae bacterium]